MIDHGLTMLDPDHEVAVTKEQHNQAALAAFAPRSGHRARRIAAELHLVTRGGRAGQRIIEVRLGGRLVGELTRLMSQRYGPVVEEVFGRGGRPGCVGLVRHGKRGLEVELRLPERPVAAPPPPAAAPSLPAAPRPPPQPQALPHRRRYCRSPTADRRERRRSRRVVVGAA